MRMINIKPVEVVGHCRANLTLDDEFQIEGVRLANSRQSNVCAFALSHLVPIVSVLQREKRFFAHARCLNCTGLGRENRVVFLLGHADKWELCQVMSEYRRLCERCEEPEVARRLKAEATQHQARGEYSAAAQKMQAALEELRRVAALRETLQYYNHV